jgi:hypothetical protein
VTTNPGGFDLEASHLTNPRRLDALLLALSVAVLWIYELGLTIFRGKSPSHRGATCYDVGGSHEFWSNPYELGEQILRDGRRSEVAPAYKRQLSVFQLGRRLLRRLISCIAPPPCTLQLEPFKPEPVWYGDTPTAKGDC